MFICCVFNPHPVHLSTGWRSMFLWLGSCVRCKHLLLPICSASYFCELSVGKCILMHTTSLTYFILHADLYHDKILNIKYSSFDRINLLTAWRQLICHSFNLESRGSEETVSKKMCTMECQPKTWDIESVLTAFFLSSATSYSCSRLCFLNVRFHNVNHIDQGKVTTACPSSGQFWKSLHSSPALFLPIIRLVVSLVTAEPWAFLSWRKKRHMKKKKTIVI